MAESQSEIVTEAGVNNFDKNLEEMAQNMKVFSSAMRDFYTKKIEAEDDETHKSHVAKRFREIRDYTRKDAIVYVECVLPITERLIQSINTYFEYYHHEVSSFEEWCKMLPDILKRTAALKHLAHAVVDMYEDMIVPIKTREDEAKMIKAEFVDLKSKHEKEFKKYKTKSNNRKICAYAVMPILGVNLIAYPLLKSARENKKLAVDSEKNLEVDENAAQIVDKILMPSLGKFIKSLENVAGFITMVEQDLHREPRANEFHYNLMKSREIKMRERCETFSQVWPSVRTDLRALPTEATDNSYVHEWFEKTLADLREKNTEEAFSTFYRVAEEKIPRYMRALRPTQERTHSELPTSPGLYGEERKQPEIPTQPVHDGQESKQPELPASPGHDGKERKQPELPTSPGHDGKERKQPELPTSPSHDGQERKQPELPTSPYHDGRKKKQPEIPTSPHHDGQERKQPKIPAPVEHLEIKQSNPAPRKHNINERKQQEMPTQPVHDGQERKQPEIQTTQNK
ncbi:uncharacterized protein LOC114523005 isoform X1 [Dendronephthya gigantea]|uniref:uncharacterized protein LOC114523005 isoform X1 n=1 Tax=Dendronephthya gigantea TaxID=151771 RepID=UPI00106BEE6E|nr:uncharacterized protein LOC114523005 isoform X1 [Dendronephthya gigantea]